MLACAHPVTVQVPWRSAARMAFFTSSTQALSGLVRMEFIRRRILFLLFFYLRNFACKYFTVLGASSILASACILHIVPVESMCFLWELCMNTRRRAFWFKKIPDSSV